MPKKTEKLVLLQCRIRAYQFENLELLAAAEYDGNRSYALRQILDLGFERYQEEADAVQAHCAANNPDRAPDTDRVL